MLGEIFGRSAGLASVEPVLLRFLELRPPSFRLTTDGDWKTSGRGVPLAEVNFGSIIGVGALLPLRMRGVTCLAMFS